MSADETLLSGTDARRTVLCPWGGPLNVFPALVALCLEGCSLAHVAVDPGLPHERIRKVAVLDLDQPGVEVQVRDKLVWGRVESRQAGRQVADIVSQALAKYAVYDMHDRVALRDLCRKKDLDQLALAKQLDLPALRKLLGTDAVVVGQIQSYGYKFVCLYQRAWAEYSARCIDLNSGAVLWAFNGSTTRLYSDESRLAIRIAAEAAQKLKRELRRWRGRETTDSAI